MADAAGAAIRRASQQARNAMQQLDAKAEEDLTQIYSEAADQVRAAIAQAGSNAAQVKLDQLRGLLERIDQVLDLLGKRRDALLGGALQQAAELGVRPLTAAGISATGRQVPPPLDGAQALRLVDEAVQFVRAFRAADGLVLSDRLWRVDRGAREAVHRTVEQAVVQGWNADKAAQDFMLRGQAVPPATAQAQQAAAVANVMRGADHLVDANTGALANTLRVVRTEVNRAHGEAYMSGAGQSDAVLGFRFLLSPRHPRPDICDLLARQNLYGLGPGVYPDRKSTPWPAHPNTLSFVVAVFVDEVSEADRAGKETTTQALARLAPELRAGVLGPTKASYFDQGLLTRGMVRSRVGDVRQRLTRQGRI
jgi:hypothetical protein